MVYLHWRTMALQLDIFWFESWHCPFYALERCFPSNNGLRPVRMHKQFLLLRRCVYSCLNRKERWLESSLLRQTAWVHILARSLAGHMTLGKWLNRSTFQLQLMCLIWLVLDQYKSNNMTYPTKFLGGWNEMMPMECLVYSDMQWALSTC